MLNKWLMLGGIVLASLVCGHAAAQQAPPGCEGGGNAGWIYCPIIEQPQQPSYTPGSGSSSVPRPRPEKPKYGYGKEYGFGYIAVAQHPQATDVWATWNQRTEQKAIQTVLNACTQVMKTGCSIRIIGRNEVVAIVRDSDNQLWPGSGNNAKAARESALILCQSYSKGCEMLHTFAAEPLKQPKIRDEKKYLNFLEDPASDVSQSYFPSQAGGTTSAGTPSTSGTLFSDPKVGVWSMLSAGDGTGKNCAVAFAEAPNGANTVLFSGPTAKGSGAILFQGPKMPATHGMREIRPTLTFKGGQSRTIDAALFSQDGKSGILVLTDMVNLMRQTSGENEVTLELDGKEVFRGNMTGFMKARSAMLECMKAG